MIKVEVGKVAKKHGKWVGKVEKSNEKQVGKVEKIMLKQVGKVEYVILIKKQEDNMLDRSAGSSSF